MLMIICLFTGLVTGFSNLGSQNFISIKVGGALLIGALGMIGLIWRSLTISQPILQLRLFTNHLFTGHVIGFFLTQIISLGFAFLLPNYIQLVNGNTPMVAGMVVLPAGFAGAVFAPLGGRILDRFDARRPIIFGITLCLISLVIFTLMARHLSNIVIACVYILYMAGMGSVMTNALTIIGKENVPQGNAILNTLQQFAGAIGTSIVAMIVASSQANLHVNCNIATVIGTQHAFILLTVFAIIVWISYYRSVK